MSFNSSHQTCNQFNPNFDWGISKSFLCKQMLNIKLKFERSRHAMLNKINLIKSLRVESRDERIIFHEHKPTIIFINKIFRWLFHVEAKRFLNFCAMKVWSKKFAMFISLNVQNGFCVVRYPLNVNGLKLIMRISGP